MNKENFLLKVYINLLLFLLVPLYSFSTIYNGGYGDYNSIKWNLDTETGILTISGTGDMPLSSAGSAPYYSHVNYIKSIIVENGITSICNGAFYNCTNLLSVSLPNTITSIGENAFSNCNKLPEIAIPNSVNIIKRAAFSQCRALTSITIPESVTEIGTALFAYCTNLEHIIVDNNNKIYDSRDNCNAIIETATNELVASCKNTTIPSTVTSIGR